MKDLIDNPKELQQLSKQARLNAEIHSSKYYGERALDVYRHAIEHKKYDNYGLIGKIVGKIKENKKEGHIKIKEQEKLARENHKRIKRIEKEQDYEASSRKSKDISK